MPTVSVLMGVYNEEEFVEAAIDSILEQTFEDFELIIVDDSSIDGTSDLVQTYDDERITILRNKTNRGLTVSLNRALQCATGEYVARQDADDISEPERLERQVAFLDTHPDVAVLGTGTVLIDEMDRAIDHRLGRCHPTFTDFLRKSHLVHGSILVRRSALVDHNGYDEFFRYGQDLDLWLRLAKHYKLANLPELLYRHRIHDEGVYFSQKDESALYSIVARDIATGRIDAAIKSELETKGITAYYDYLDADQRAGFHSDLATRYLRYGHTQPALEECRKAREYERFAVRPVLLSLLAKIGPRATNVVKWGMRRYLNLKTRVHNWRHCPYDTSENHPHE